MTKHHLIATLAAVALVGPPALAQQSPADSTKGSPVVVASANGSATDSGAKAATKKDTTTEAAKPAPTVASRAAALQQAITIQHIRPLDQRGINVFEAPKFDDTPYNGFALQWGAAFTQQFQGLDHRNRATPVISAGVNQNQLMRMGHGFNNAVANLYLNAQLARGIRVSLTSYMSARHHNEMWVKDGYLLIDESPLSWQLLQDLMTFVTVKAGHFEINYGDQHFRRTDNGHALYNPFVGNLIMDAFTTEVGGEVYVRLGGAMLMGGVTNGEVRGTVLNPQKRSPALLGKAGFDRQVMSDLRVRLTGSIYSKRHSNNNTLYSGDRAGSRYYDVMENTTSSETAQAWSGAIQPKMSDKITAMVVNPFVKFHGLELFGNIERAKGRAGTESRDRTWDQLAGEAVYRFFSAEQVWVGGRYNTAKGKLALTDPNEKVTRYQASTGWFITPGIVLKGEYVTQKYYGFRPTDIRHGGKFNGFVVEGVVAF
ncbi:MAG TPA: hypothetical protein VHM30_09605 [Gemmatimonadaceae bacterium]|nr:hypothetical protein [Gemmatimonadaceae bacterium]